MNSDILHPDVWKYDLENRGYTIEETSNSSLTLIVVKESGVEVGREEASGREGIWIVRERLEGGESLLPCLTTNQRDLHTFKLGHQIINVSNGNVVEYWDGGVWNTVGIKAISNELFNPTNGQTVFVLAASIGGGLSSMLFVNGMQYSITVDYTISGVTLTWLDVDFTLEVGDVVDVFYEIA